MFCRYKPTAFVFESSETSVSFIISGNLNVVESFIAHRLIDSSIKLTVIISKPFYGIAALKVEFGIARKSDFLYCIRMRSLYDVKSVLLLYCQGIHVQLSC